MKLTEVKERFKSHVLTPILETEETKIFEFRKPKEEHNSFVHWQRWIIDKGTLIVQGDNGAAVYTWNSKGISLEFLASCNLDYFSEKCLADRAGSNQDTFEADEAAEVLKDIATERLASEMDEEDLKAFDWENKTLDERMEFFKDKILNEGDFQEYEFDGLFLFEREADAFDFINEKENEFLFGSDPWEYDLRSKTPTPFYHLAALQVANEKHPGAF